MNFAKNKLIYIGAGILCLIAIFFSINMPNDPAVIDLEQKSSADIPNVTVSPIFVQVSGAVKSPGLYEMKSGDRINDLLTISGATKYNHDCINLAQKLVDEQEVYIPKSGEVCPQNSAIGADGTVNINSASAIELQSISGIGEAKAQNIVEYRNANGSFEQKEDLANVEGISEKLLDSISSDITLS